MRNVASWLREDRFLLLLAVAGLCFELALLSHQMRWIPVSAFGRFRSDTKNAIGLVAEKNRQLTVRGQESLTWYPLAQSESVRENDTLMTGVQSSAVIKLEGRGEVLMGPNTLIRFLSPPESRMGDLIALEVHQGAFRVRAKEKRVRLRLEKREMILEPAAEVSVAQSPSVKRAEVLVERGQVRVEGIQREGRTIAGESLTLDLKAGEMIKIEENLLVSPISRELNAVPLSPENDSKILLENEGENVVLRWDGDEADVLEISTSRNFSDLRGVMVKSKSASARLKTGRYFWRVRRGGVVSQSFSFSVLLPYPYRDLSGVSERAVLLGNPVVLRWNREPDVQQMQIQISQDPTFKELILNRSEYGNQIEFTPENVGAYYWRVRARHAEFGDWAPSSSFQFRVKEKMTAPKIKGGKVLPKKSSSYSPSRDWWSWIERLAAVFESTAYADEEVVSVELEWEEIKGAEAYRIEISADKNFAKPLKRLDVRDPKAFVELNRLPVYYWRVAGKDSDGDVGRFSATQELLPPMPTPVVSKPVTKTEVTARASNVPSPFFPHVFRLGISTGYRSLSELTSQVNVDSQGWTLNRVISALEWRWNLNGFGVAVDYQRVRFKSMLSSEIQRDLFASEWAADFFYRRRFNRELFLSGGFRYSRVSNKYRVNSAGEVGITSKEYMPLFLSVKYLFLLTRTVSLGSETFLRTSLWGQKVGFNVDERIFFELPITSLLSAEADLMAEWKRLYTNTRKEERRDEVKLEAAVFLKIIFDNVAPAPTKALSTIQ